ncbi:MAG: hypothetical protein J7M29_05720, partial [Verrucomicrobia bacterium]|nr:hypothetical protein [Verrucomicrobiota bacterium]
MFETINFHEFPSQRWPSPIPTGCHIQGGRAAKQARKRHSRSQISAAPRREANWEKNLQVNQDGARL